jgi:hypothetical protein
MQEDYQFACCLMAHITSLAFADYAFEDAKAKLGQGPKGQD